VHGRPDSCVDCSVARAEECSLPTWSQVYDVEVLSAVDCFVPRVVQVAYWTHTEAMAASVVFRLAVERIDSAPSDSIASSRSGRVPLVVALPVEQT